MGNRKDLKITGTFFLVLAVIGLVLVVCLDRNEYQFLVDHYLFVPLGLLAVFLHIMYFRTKRSYSWYIMTAGILAGLAVAFLIEGVTDWKYSIYLWPNYVLAVLIGFIETHIFDKRSHVRETVRILFCVYIGLALMTLFQYLGYDGADVSIIIALVIIGVVFLTQTRKK